jgi:hypothetical protein
MLTETSESMHYATASATTPTADDSNNRQQASNHHRPEEPRSYTRPPPTVPIMEPHDPRFTPSVNANNRYAVVDVYELGDQVRAIHCGSRFAGG